MDFIIKRFITTAKETISVGYLDPAEPLCFILEDTSHEKKIAGETRIPAGRYKISLRTFGGHHERYKERFQFHVGMFELLDVPQFTDILFHIGIKNEDTEGCLLPGNAALITPPRSLVDSTNAYIRVYKQLLPHALDGSLYFDIRD